MRVLVVSATFPPMKSGGADYALRLCRRLAEAGLEVHVLTSRIENVATDPSLNVYPVMRRWSWLELPRLLKIVRFCKPEVVNLHFIGLIYNNHPMITFLPTILKRLNPQLRVVTHIEFPSGVRSELMPWSTRAVSRAVTHWAGPKNVDYGYGTILRDSERLIVLSDAHRITLAKHFAGADEKCVLIPPPPIMPMSAEANGAARRHGRELLQVKPDEFLLAYFGYIYPDKGLESLLEAFSRVVQKRRDVRLVLIGGSNEVMLKTVNRPHYVQELRTLAKHLNIADKVIWTGYYPSESDRGSLYLRSADMCVLPFDTGVYLNNSSFTAAAAHGLPIITTKGAMLEPPIINLKNVLLCQPKESTPLASAIISLMDDPEMRRQLSTGALKLAQEWFSWNDAVRRTIGAFEAPGLESN